MHLQWWETIQFVEMSLKYRLWLGSFSNKSLQGIFIHNAEIRKLNDGVFGFPSHKKFQACQLDVITQTGGVDSACKLAEPLMSMYTITVVLRQFPFW